MRPKVRAVTTLLPGGMQLSCLTQIELEVKDLIYFVLRFVSTLRSPEGSFRTESPGQAGYPITFSHTQREAVIPDKHHGW
jgi:hypothetical protein